MKKIDVKSIFLMSVPPTITIGKLLNSVGQKPT